MSEQHHAHDFEYVGNELDLFSAASNWKAHWASAIAPYVGREVLDVGAGIGATARLLCDPSRTRWLALEPDAGLAARISGAVRQGELPASCHVRVGTLDDMPAGEQYDTILYIDVLEHIEADRSELAHAAAFLRPGGRVVVLSPAHQWLYTDFDHALGHFRRYTRRSLAAATPEALTLERIMYLDSVGIIASLANRLFLRQSSPTPKQIATWDRVMVPVSRVLDPLCGYALGKSIIGIWRAT